jgi:2-polyprenyl-3-methyl-5-hydroxy-6-metoxy-1,4-benzoquinol methylase
MAQSSEPPSRAFRALRAIRGLTRYRLPARLTSRWRMIDTAAMQSLRDQLLAFRQRTAGVQPVADDELPDDDLLNHLHRRLDDNRRQVVPWLEAARPLDGAAVLEIGCGTGSATVPLAEQGARVTAIDLDERSIEVAQARCRLYGVEARFEQANAAELAGTTAAARYDFIIFYASLEHMTHVERLAAMSRTWNMLASGGLWCVIETPNRLWYYDHHTAHLNFFMWLSDELASDYLRFSPRDDIRGQVLDAEDRRLALCRAGRGVSFHEFDLARGPAERLQVVSSLPLFYRERDPALWLRWRWSDEHRYESFLARLCPRLHRGFLQPTLYLIVRKP